VVNGNVLNANLGVFSMPKPDVNGVCNTLFGVRYLEGTSDSCINDVKLEEECTSTLNP
jgi:hypothetical protein